MPDLAPRTRPGHGGGAVRHHRDLHPRTEKTKLMSENLTDTTDLGADEATSEDAVHGRHRGGSAADDTNEADAHGRHRLDAASN